MLTSPARGQQPGGGRSSNYLSSYPYLFVRETEQTDYFCTSCEESLQEIQLHTHLFRGHSAQNLQDYFVRISRKVGGGSARKDSQYICVVCWAKLSKESQMVGHRESCKANFNDEPGIQSTEPPTSVISTPDIHTLEDIVMEDGDEDCGGTAGGVSPPQPEVILDTDCVTVGSKYGKLDLQDIVVEGVLGPGVGRRDGDPLPPPVFGEPVYTSQCMQCSLCAMILPSTSYLSHLRAYHRVTCSLTSLNCPLCMTSVPVMDLTVHLASQHGLVPQTAVNGLLLWALCSNTFSLNDAAQASLKAKFKSNLTASITPKQTKPNSTSTPLNSSSSMLKSSPIMSLSGGGVAPKTGGSRGGVSLLPSSSTSSLVITSQTAATTSNSVKAESEPVLINDMRGKVSIDRLMGKLTRSHLGPAGKQSHQCLVCSKWYAVPPIKHMRSHITNLRQEKRKVLQLVNNMTICLICYRLFDSQHGAAGHLSTHTQDGAALPGLPGGSVAHCLASPSAAGGLLAEALLGFQFYTKTPGSANIPPSLSITATDPILNSKLAAANAMARTNGVKSGRNGKDNDDLPLGATFETPGLKPPNSPDDQLVGGGGTGEDGSAKEGEVNVELDNAGRVKSGKVRKQCELCGEWSNIKWFFKHMSEVHQALFCRCCREYLPKEEHKEHRHWHSMPPYMGQKIRIENSQPIIIDRKERASLTPIGSLAAWGGSSGGLVVKTASSTGGEGNSGLVGLQQDGNSTGRDSLMPKERCPVCGIEITHKNLARHIKLRHGIKYKFCYKCRKLVPGQLYLEHKALHDAGELETVNGSDNDFADSFREDDGVIEIPEEILDDVMDGSTNGRKDETFRANTSMTKLESLMGREFKHPRRKCNICGYSVSYSNFKRHLRNAHPGEMEDGQKDGLADGGDCDMVGHNMDDSDRAYENSVGDDGENSLLVEGYKECHRCGDHVMPEFMGSHLRMVHNESMTGSNNSSSSSSSAGSKEPGSPEAGGEGSTVRVATEGLGNLVTMRACPECDVEMRTDTVVKHCKMKHKISYRLCGVCSKFILKKQFRLHTKLHHGAEELGEDGQPDELNTSKEDEEEDNEVQVDEEEEEMEENVENWEEEEGDDANEIVIDGDVTVAEPPKISDFMEADPIEITEDSEDGLKIVTDLPENKEDKEEPEIIEDGRKEPKESGKLGQIFNCLDCTRMFMSEEGYSKHLKEVHEGEGGHVILPVPEEKTEPDEEKKKKEEVNEKVGGRGRPKEKVEELARNEEAVAVNTRSSRKDGNRNKRLLSTETTNSKRRCSGRTESLQKDKEDCENILGDST